jgi:hypothetical protein
MSGFAEFDRYVERNNIKPEGVRGVAARVWGGTGREG